MFKKERDIEKMKKYAHGCRVTIPSKRIKCAYRAIDSCQLKTHEKNHVKCIMNAPKKKKSRYYEYVESVDAKAIDNSEKSAKYEDQTCALLETPRKGPVINDDPNLAIDNLDETAKYEHQMCALLETPQKGPVINNDPNFTIDMDESTKYKDQMSALFETPQKGPVINNDPNLNAATFHFSPL